MTWDPYRKKSDPGVRVLAERMDDGQGQTVVLVDHLDGGRLTRWDGDRFDAVFEAEVPIHSVRHEAT